VILKLARQAAPFLRSGLDKLNSRLAAIRESGGSTAAYWHFVEPSGPLEPRESKYSIACCGTARRRRRRGPHAAQRAAPGTIFRGHRRRPISRAAAVLNRYAASSGASHVLSGGRLLDSDLHRVFRSSRPHDETVLGSLDEADALFPITSRSAAVVNVLARGSAALEEAKPLSGSTRAR